MSLIITQLSKSFVTKKGSIEALRNVNLHVEAGECVCIVGASGSGKSTLLRIVAGLERQTSGQVEVDGVAIQQPGAERGMVFQSYTLYPWMTAQKNVEFGLKLQGADHQTRRDRAEYYLNIVGMSRFRGAYPNELSGGMQQRVAIARALATQPKILLMDEPFGALDVQTRELMQEFLRDLWQQTGCTILTITHDVREAVFLSQRVYMLTAQPGTIAREFTIDLPEERDYRIERTPQFQMYVSQIQDLLRGVDTSSPASLPAIPPIAS